MAQETYTYIFLTLILKVYLVQLVELFVAMRRATAGTAGIKPANFSGNNNTYHVNTNNNNYIYAEGTTAASLVNAYYIKFYCY